MRLHILGASGSGTSTLGKAFAAHVNCVHFDTDDFFWLPTVPPFQTARSRQERLDLLDQSLKSAPSWVLSGSLCGWGDPLIQFFTLVVFLVVPSEARLRRLYSREIERYGVQAISQNGSLHDRHRMFMNWASAYDTGDLTMRSKLLHDEWISKLRCPVLILEGERSPDGCVRSLLNFIGAI